jgi:hypothetical protein
VSGRHAPGAHKMLLGAHVHRRALGRILEKMQADGAG